MNQKLIKFLSIVSINILTLGICIIGIETKLNAASSNIYYITTCVGEEETSIGINYHCNYPTSKVIYSTSSSFANAETITATSTEWSSDQINDDKKTGFAARYVCTANLDNLLPSTQYYYKIEAGNEISDVYSFTTHNRNAASTNILFATDIHASASMSSTSSTVNEIWTKINKKFANMNLVVMTGDQVDRGGYESEWQSLYSGMTCFNKLIQATIPGNHEYYHSKDSSYVSPAFYNQFYNNPKNGPTNRLNSSYYFHYGDILFVMIDTINREYLEEQKAWFEDVMKNNTSKWVIVGTHAGGITAGVYAHDAQWIQKEWLPLWEQYQVDLCLSGHEHIYIRKDLTYQDEQNNDLGITYLVGPAAGHKQYQTIDTEGMIVKSGNFSVNVITVRGSKLTITLYDKNAEETDYTITLKSKRNDQVTSMTDQEILDSIQLEQDKINNNVTISWNANLYGNVYDVVATRVLEGHSVDFRTVISTSKMTSLKVNTVYPDLNYQIKLKITKTDGNILEKEYNLIPTKEYKLTLNLNDGILQNSENWTSYTSNNEIQLPIPTKDGYSFIGWYDNAEFTGDAITHISSTTFGNLNYYAKWEKITDTSKKCGKKSNLIVELLSISSLLYLILKKHQ